MVKTQKNTNNGKTRWRYAVYLSGSAAALYVISMLVAQLMGFEIVNQAIEDYWLPGAFEPLAIAGMVVIAELLCLPYLLRMRVSPLFSLISRMTGWLVLAWWVFVALWTSLQATALLNIGVFGDIIMVPPGVGAVGVTGLLAIFIIVANGIEVCSKRYDTV